MSRRMVQVRHFHKAFGLVINKRPTLVDDRLMQLRINLIDDEVKEFDEGVVKSDLENIIKELCDIDYVVIGAAVAYGFKDVLRVRDRFEHVSSFGPMIYGGNRAVWHSMLLHAYADSFRNASRAKDLDAIKSAIFGLLQTTMMIAGDYSFDIKPYFEEVHRSNMSKVWHDGKVHYREDGKVEKPPYYSKADIKSLMAKQVSKETSQ